MSGMTGLGYLGLSVLDAVHPGLGKIISICLIFLWLCAILYLDHVYHSKLFGPKWFRRRFSN
jgi:hypothetical protein